MTVLHPTPTDPVDPGLLSHALEVGGRLANDAAEVIAATANRSADTHLFDWVTDTHRTLERHTRRVLAAHFPDIPVVGPVIGAEYDTGGQRYRWLVAPVDGTANYLAGLPWYGYSLALVDALGPVVGVISDPTHAEIYAAARGRGTRVNGVPVRVAPAATGQGHPVCVELGADGRWVGFPAFLEEAVRSGRGVRVLGSAALAITQVALGHSVAALVRGYRPWDVAAGVALALEAGAVVVGRALPGRPVGDIGGGERVGGTGAVPRGGLLVAAPAVASEVLAWWRAAEAEDGR